MPVTLARWDEAKGNRKACQGSEGCWFVAERGKNLNQVLEWQLGPRNLLESGWDILHPPAPDAAGGSKGCAATALGNRSEVGLQPSTRRLYLPKTCLTQCWLPVGTHPTNAWWRGPSPCPFSSALWERSKEAREGSIWLPQKLRDTGPGRALTLALPGGSGFAVGSLPRAVVVERGTELAVRPHRVVLAHALPVDLGGKQSKVTHGSTRRVPRHRDRASTEPVLVPRGSSAVTRSVRLVLVGLHVILSCNPFFLLRSKRITSRVSSCSMNFQERLQKPRSKASLGNTVKPFSFSLSQTVRHLCHAAAAALTISMPSANTREHKKKEMNPPGT